MRCLTVFLLVAGSSYISSQQLFRFHEQSKDAEPLRLRSERFSGGCSVTTRMVATAFFYPTIRYQTQKRPAKLAGLFLN